MSIKAVVFSKDRPLQLHATLFSFAARCLDADKISLCVLFRASDPFYQQGYDMLASECRGKLDVAWVAERDFKKDLLGQVEKSGHSHSSWLTRFLGKGSEPVSDHLLFMVDDNIFVRSFNCGEAVHALESHEKALGFSLRIGRNTNYCYSNNCRQKLPDFRSVSGKILSFSWIGEEGDFGYPLEVSSSLYRSSDLLPLLGKLPYKNPNRLEQGLSVSARLLSRRRPDLLCFEESVAFCAPVNKVQSVLDNRSGKSEIYSSERLNEMFLGGYRVDIRALNGFVPNAAHQEIDLPLERTI